jgi:hypothetical protein
LDVVKGYLVMERKESKTLMGIATEYGLSSEMERETSRIRSKSEWREEEERPGRFRAG